MNSSISLSSKSSKFQGHNVKLASSFKTVPLTCFSRTVTEICSLLQTSWLLRNLFPIPRTCPVGMCPITRHSVTLPPVEGAPRGQQEILRQQPQYKNLSNKLVPTDRRETYRRFKLGQHKKGLAALRYCKVISIQLIKINEKKFFN